MADDIRQREGIATKMQTHSTGRRIRQSLRAWLLRRLRLEDSWEILERYRGADESNSPGALQRWELRRIQASGWSWEVFCGRHGNVSLWTRTGVVMGMGGWSIRKRLVYWWIMPAWRQLRKVKADGLDQSTE